MWTLLVAMTMQMYTYGAFDNKTDCLEAAETLRKLTVKAVCIQFKQK